MAAKKHRKQIYPIAKALAHVVQGRLISWDGRPRDPHWDTKQLVPFSRQVWKRLVQEADRISKTGFRVGPTQLAAIMIEEALASLKSGAIQSQTWFLPLEGQDQVWKVSSTGYDYVWVGIPHLGK